MRRPDFQFEIIGEGSTRQYRPFDACVRATGIPSPGPETIPLTNQCPLFTGTAQEHLPARIVNDELPEGAKLPRKPGVYFLSNAIEAMAYGLGMSKEQIIEVLERIERRFESAGLDEQGHHVKNPRRPPHGESMRRAVENGRQKPPSE